MYFLRSKTAITHCTEIIQRFPGFCTSNSLYKERNFTICFWLKQYYFEPNNLFESLSGIFCIISKNQYIFKRINFREMNAKDRPRDSHVGHSI